MHANIQFADPVFLILWNKMPFVGAISNAGRNRVEYLSQSCVRYRTDWRGGICDGVSSPQDCPKPNMQKPLKSALVAAKPTISSGRACPRCHGDTYPLKRGFLQAVVGHQSMLFRYQCDSYRCSDREIECGEGSSGRELLNHHTAESAGCHCPRCGGETFRIERRLTDLLISRFSVVHRYQCDSRLCDWSGLVRQDHRAHPADN